MFCYTCGVRLPNHTPEHAARIAVLDAALADAMKANGIGDLIPATRAAMNPYAAQRRRINAALNARD